MSGTKYEEEKEPSPENNDHDGPNSTVHQDDSEKSMDDPKTSDFDKQDPSPCPVQEEETIKKKYGGLLPKKLPLISQDHEHAFFDSADWALRKQGAQRSKGPLEALRPKLQPTPHQQVRSRRSAYAPSDDDGEGSENSNSSTPSEEDHIKALDGFSDDNFHPEGQSHHN